MGQTEKKKRLENERSSPQKTSSPTRLVAFVAKGTAREKYGTWAVPDLSCADEETALSLTARSPHLSHLQ